MSGEDAFQDTNSLFKTRTLLLFCMLDLQMTTMRTCKIQRVPLCRRQIYCG